MAVQAQYPSTDTSAFVNDLLRRGLHQFDNLGLTIASGEQLQSNLAVSNLLRAPHAAVGWIQHQQTLQQSAIAVGTENLFKCNAAKAMKRARAFDDDEDVALFIKKPFISLEAPRCNLSSNSMPSPSGLGNPTCTPLSSPSKELQCQMSKYWQEVGQLFELQAMQLKQALENSRMKHTREMLSTIEQAVRSRMKLAGDELDKAVKKNLELEEKARQLSVEAQLWQNLARNNELMAYNLRHSLELVIAQAQQEHVSKEGCGESQIDDAQSCCVLNGEGASAGAEAYRDMAIVKNNQHEHGSNREPRKCRVCNIKEVCILLLPCRHLCLCEACEGALNVCPLCRGTKNASVQVYMQ